MEAASSSDDDSSTASSASSFDDELVEQQETRPMLSRDDQQNDRDNDDSSSSSPSSNDDEHVSSSDDDEDDDNDDELRKLPLAERIKRQQERGVDLRARRERQQKAKKVAAERLHKVKKQQTSTGESSKATTKKKSRHAPAEVSSKRSDFYKRRFDLNESGIGVEIGKHRFKPVDPRVNNLNGHLDVEHFETNYAFLQDMRQKEITLLKKRISARKKTGPTGHERRRRLGITTDGSTLEEDQEALKTLLHEKAELDRRQVDRAAKRTVKQKLQRQVAEGKAGVYFPKRKELKRLHLEAKFDELRKRGGEKAVDRALAKRRKKNKSKDAGLLGGRTI